MEIKVKIDDKRAEIKVIGDFGDRDLAKFNKALNETVSLGCDQLIIDMKRVDRLTLHGLAALNLCARLMLRRQGSIMLANAGPQVKRALTQSRLISLLELCGSKKRPGGNSRAGY